MIWNCCYDIAMQTAIGIRYGTMTVDVDENVVHGTLNILRKANPFSGKIDHEGNCRIHGTIMTLMRTIVYYAEGQITESEIRLRLKGERECFEISGTSSTSNMAGERKTEI